MITFFFHLKLPNCSHHVQVKPRKQLIKKGHQFICRVKLNFGSLFCPLNKASAKRKHSKLRKYHKKFLILYNKIYNEFFKFIGYYFKET